LIEQVLKTYINQDFFRFIFQLKLWVFVHAACDPTTDYRWPVLLAVVELINGVPQQSTVFTCNKSFSYKRTSIQYIGLSDIKFLQRLFNVVSINEVMGFRITNRGVVPRHRAGRRDAIYWFSRSTHIYWMNFPGDKT